LQIQIQLLQNGVLTVDEVRQMRGLTTLPAAASPDADASLILPGQDRQVAG
jgi:hypothetical protein